MHKSTSGLFQLSWVVGQHRSWSWIPSLLLVFVMLSCSRDTDTTVLFEGEPGLSDLPDNVVFEPVAGGALTFNFSTLEYETHIREKSSGESKLIYTSMVSLKDKNKQLAVTKTEYYFVQPEGLLVKQVTDVDVGVPGIVSLVQLSSKRQKPLQIQYLKVARSLREVSGRLFPLENGNELSLSIGFAYQVNNGAGKPLPQNMDWSYRFRVVRQYEGYTLLDRTIPGNVHIIERRETDPNGNVDHTMIHYLEAYGAVVKIIRQSEEIIEETTLIGMED